MFIEIVTPDKKIFEGEATSAIFPGTDGSFQILNNHAALVSTLGKGSIVFVKTLNNLHSNCEIHKSMFTHMLIANVLRSEEHTSELQSH
jgi:F-type H+-transporting ATPase subunit epsilon